MAGRKKATDKTEVLSPLKADSAVKGRQAAGKVAKSATATKAKKPAKPRKPKAAAKAAVEKDAAPKQVKYEKRFVDLARRMFLAKVPDDEIADFFGIDTEELEWWKEEHHEFGEAFRPDQRSYGGGRPSEYDPKHVSMALALAKLGATDLEIAQAFEKSVRTINRWKLEHPEFAEALQMGKDIIDQSVEQSLYKRAVGYTFDSEKIVVIEGEAQRVEIIEHVPPDTKAAMWWLQNRRPGVWRDVRHIKHDVDKGSALGNWLDKLNGTTFQPQEDASEPTKSSFQPVEDEDEG